MKLFLRSILVVSLLGLFLIAGRESFAASLINSSDTITTSRPSAASPLSANLASGDAQASIFNNGSRYLASDSARLIRTSTGGIIVNGLTVASQSAALTTVYFTATAGTAAQAGTDVLIAPMTAMHTVQFTTNQAIPATGQVVINFPGAADNAASPSASDFAFNALSNTNIKTNNITCNTLSVTSPTITCTTNAGVAANTVVTFLIGCSAATGAACTTQVPTLINPTKAATAGTADRWKVRIDTLDASTNALDTASVSVGTIESVQVLATVDPTLTFTIAGITNGTAVNNGNATGCTNSETTDAGLDATATVVNLGTLSNTPTSTNTKVGNIAAQLLTISTNGLGGYSLTATSAGQLMNASSGFAVISSTTPAVFPNGTPWFGVHPCGLDVSAATWTSSGANQNCATDITGSAGNLCKYAWPTQTGAVSLASDSSGPIGNSLTAGNGLVSVEYAAGVDASVPAGTYQSVVTYVATATF